MAEQSNDAAERSASIVRGEAPAEAGPGVFVEGPGPSAQLRVVADLQAENAALREDVERLKRNCDIYISMRVKAEAELAQARLPLDQQARYDVMVKEKQRVEAALAAQQTAFAEYRKRCPEAVPALVEASSHEGESPVAEIGTAPEDRHAAGTSEGEESTEPGIP